MSRIKLATRPGMSPVTSPPHWLPRLARCFCRALIPPGRACCWAHSSRLGDEEVTAVAQVQR